MILTELLKAQGIADDVIAKITAAMKENKIFTASEENLDVRYGKLKTDHEGLTKQLEEANGLIEQFKKSSKGNEDLQGKITDYESKVKNLEQQLSDTKLEAAIKVALLSEKALDVDYLTFKLKSKIKDENRTLTLDDNGNIKGADELISGLKTQFPGQFESSSSKKIEEHKLEQGNGKPGTLTKQELLKKPYAERMKIFNENPDAYHAAMKAE